MNSTRCCSLCKFATTPWAVMLFALTVALGLTPRAQAQDTCSAGVNPGIITAAPYNIGDVVRESLEIQISNISGGTMATIASAIVKLDCDVGSPVTTDACVDDGLVKSFVGFVSSDCPGGVVWTPDTTVANTVVFDAVPDLMLPPNSSCEIVYDVMIEGLSNDATQLVVEQAQGFDATCDNAAPTATARGSLALPLTVDCQVGIEKEVSCDGGTNWGPDCVAPLGGSTMTRVVINNTGGEDVTCDVDDDVHGLGVVSGETVAAGGSSTIVIDEGVCEARVVNTASLVNCTCLGDFPAEVEPASDTAQIDCCGVQIDKRISCNESTGGGSDVADANGLQTMNGDGTDGCDAIQDTSLTFNYDVNNAGSVDLLDCSFSDMQSGPGSNILCSVDGQEAGVGFDLTSGGGTTPVAGCDGSEESCTEEFNTAEGAGNTASVTCTCADPAGEPIELTASAFDTADVDCVAPGLNITKECIDNGDGTHTANVFVENTGDVDLSNCTITDTLLEDAGTDLSCGAISGDETETDIPVNGAIGNPGFNLPVGSGEMTATGTFSSPDNDACNQAQITCFLPDGVTEFPAGPAFADCDVTVGGCFTRTPGYWAEHPDQCNQVLQGSGGTLNSCGLALTSCFESIDAPGTNEAPPFTFNQDLCSVGSDKNEIGTSPQQMQLIRQCAAATLNLAASSNAGVDCDQAFTGIDATYNDCCVELCPSGASPDAMTECIGALDAFNNAPFDDETFETFGIVNSSADPLQCQLSSNDGDANDTDENDGRDYGPKK